ncbi:MAG: hypothetical protein QXH37_02850, partial [Candidatus Bathyarchaeia archaeon]
MADLSVNFVGLELKNPIIASSATPTYCAKFIKKAEDGGAGAVVTKTVRFRTEFITRPRFMLVNKGADYDYSLTEKGAYFTLFRASDPYPIADKFVDELKKAKKMVNIPIIVSIGGDTAEEYEKLAIMMQEAGADALELNFHFPRNKTIQVYVDMLKAVKKVAKVPVIAKLMYAWHDPVEAAKQMEVAGADAITALGSVSLSALEIDVDNARPYLQPTHYGPGGSWFRPISLSYVEKVAKAVKLPIYGVTGVVDW